MHEPDFKYDPRYEGKFGDLTGGLVAANWISIGGYKIEDWYDQAVTINGQRVNCSYQEAIARVVEFLKADQAEKESAK